MQLQAVVGSSPRHSKQSLKTMLSQSQGNNGEAYGNSTSGKKTTGSFKHPQTTDGSDHIVSMGQNNLIMSRGRPNQIQESTVRAANMHQTTSLPGNQMNYSKTLTQHMQQIQSNSTGYPSNTGKNTTKGLQKRGVQGGTSSVTHLNQTAVSTQKTGKALHNRNGSNNPVQNNQLPVQSMAATLQATPQRHQENLNSKIKSKKRLSQKRQLGSTNSNQNQQQASNSNSNSRGNLLISYNQLSYLKHSLQLQEARNNRDGIVNKKSTIKSTSSNKKGSAQRAQDQQAVTQNVVNQSHQNNTNTTQNMMQAPHTSQVKVGMTGITDNSSFNNMTIRSGDKYNSTLRQVKQSTGGNKQRQINNLEQQVLQNAQMQMGHPLSAKNMVEKPKNIFQASGHQNANTNSTQNLNQTNQNLIANNYKSSNMPTGASKHYLNGGGSMIELSTGIAVNNSKPQGTSVGPQVKNGNHTTNMNSASVFQRSHHQIYHSKNQSIGGVSQSSVNSRFTHTRPKNPTDGSLSSKGSMDSAGHFGVTTNQRLQQKIVSNHNQAQQPVVSQVNIALLNQQPQTQVDPDYLTNQSIISPQKQGGTQAAITASYATNKTASSKFNLVNRGAAMMNAGQFPAVVVNNNGNNVNRPIGVLSPKINNNGGANAASQRVISQSMSTKNFNGMPIQQVQKQQKQLLRDSKQNRQLSMKLQPSGQSQEILQSQQQLLVSQQQLQQQTVAMDQLTKSQQHTAILQAAKQQQDTIVANKTPNQVTEGDIISQTNGPLSHARSELQGYHIPATDIRAKQKDNKVKHEEQIVSQSMVKQAPTQKGLASASAPNLNISSTVDVKAVNLTTDKPVSKQLNSLRQQLKTQILKQTSHLQNTRSQKSEQGQQSMKEISSSMYNSNPQQPSSSIGVNVEIKFPISSRQALQLYQNSGLTDYEKIEIQNYPEVYFLGLEATKIKATSLLGHNFGFDDERGDYHIVVKDHLAYRFEVIDKLGSGSFGQALKCFDHKTQAIVAIKVIRNKKRFQHQAGVELRLLRFLKSKDKNDENNIVRVHDYAIFRKHLLLSFELLSMNLYEFIKQNNFQGVSTGLIRRFAIQILQALKFQRDQNIIHCDLKPENILLKQPNKSGIKIIDYGSSCFTDQRIYTYIQSRFYRAPEIVLGIPYTTSIDMWSFGCIMAELYTGYPLFPGENEAEQLAYVMEIKGIPPEYIIELSSRRNLFFEKDSVHPVIVTNSRGRRRLPNTKTLQNVLKKCQDQKFLDFIDLCLDWDPVNRMTPLEALQHEWILEGLPEKVLVHHKKMFGGKDDKMNLKEASLTPIQGFPEEANSKTIYDIVAELRSTDQRNEQPKERGSSENARSQMTVHKQSSKDTIKMMQKSVMQQNTEANNNHQSSATKTSKKSNIQTSAFIKQIQDGQANIGSSVTDSATTESPSKHRKIVRGFPQSQSTKVLHPPNTVQLEKTMKILTNNITIMTDTSDKKRDQDLVQSHHEKQSTNARNFKHQTDNGSQVQNSMDRNSCENTAKPIISKHSRKLINFDNYKSHESAVQQTESATEQQDHINLSPSELKSMKKQALFQQALIAKNHHQTQVPLNQLMVKDETCIADDIEVENVSDLDGNQPRLQGQQVFSKFGGVVQIDQIPDILNTNEVEDDYEDMVTPTDDEGITNLNHTQKIPISLIKAKDKASKLFQPIPQTLKQNSGGQSVSSKVNGSNNTNYYFAAASYGQGHRSVAHKTGIVQQPNVGPGSASKNSQSQKRMEKKQKASGAESMTPKQVMMIANLQQKGVSKLSMNTGNSSSKGSTQSKVPSIAQRNEYLSVQQTKNQYSSGAGGGGSSYATQRSLQSQTKEEQKLHQQLISTGQMKDHAIVEPGQGTYSQRTKKESSKVFLASQSAANLSTSKKNTNSASQPNNVLYHRSK